MTEGREKTSSRREFLKLTASTAALGPFFLFPQRTRASQKSLRIARWAHFLPEYNQWFDHVYAEEWSKQRDIRVQVETIPVDDVASRAAAEITGGKGHDLFMFPWPPAQYQAHAIDHTEIYQAVATRHGNVNRIGHKSTFNPKSKRYFAFCDSWMPTPFHYLEDYWEEIGAPFGPMHYGGLRSGAKRVRAKRGIPCGLALGPNLDGNITLHTLLHAFGGQVLDADGNVNIYRNYATITALKYVKALYEDAGTPDQFTWRSSGNSRALQARKTSCTISAISLLRNVENEQPEAAKNVMISPPLLGSAGVVMALPQVTSCSVIWNFSENKDGAKQFLVDLIDNFKQVYEKSQGCNFPIYQNTVPNLIRLLETDPKADPSYKYTRLKDALHWTPNLGFPGYATPAAMEVFNTFVIPRMFKRVITGELSAEDAARAAETEVKAIAEKWSKV
jgi:multiple sugar transport system substrate-binding protein